MKIGTMTPEEFQSGSGMARLRHQENATTLRKKADEARARFNKRISALADQRLKLLVPWWHQKFPKRQLKIIFGNGTEHIRIDGRSYYSAPYPPHPAAPHGGTHAQIHRRNKLNWPMFVPPGVFYAIDRAIRDVDGITNGHRDGVPADFVIEPIKKRGSHAHLVSSPPAP